MVCMESSAFYKKMYTVGWVLLLNCVAINVLTNNSSIMENR